MAFFFFFVSRTEFLNLPHLPGGLPRHQDLRQRGLLFERQVSLDDVFSHRWVATSVVVSHRWFGPTHPDPDNEKLAKVQAFVDGHPEVDSVWLDWLCVPQSHVVRLETPRKSVTFRGRSTTSICCSSASRCACVMFETCSEKCLFLFCVVLCGHASQ